MPEGVQASDTSVASSDGGGFRRWNAALAPIGAGLLSIGGYWKLPAGSHSGETLLVVGIGLIVLGVFLGVTRKAIPNPRDYYGGLVLLMIALFAIWASNDLPGTAGFAFGPGTGPRMFSVVLGALSIVVMLVGIFAEGPGIERYDIRPPLLIIAAALLNQLGQNFNTRVVVAGIALVLGIGLGVIGMMRPSSRYVRGPFFVTLGIVFFALTVRPLGLVIASYVTMVLSAYASDEVRWFETLIWAAVMTAFCSFLFPVALNLPLQLWPVNLNLSTLINLK
jgi:putative tricarboxylic transport membrane protein